MPYVDETTETLVNPIEVGKRIMILYSAAYLVHNPGDLKEIREWLKAENLWEQTSTKEKQFFNELPNDERSLIDFSWSWEAAYCLAWTAGLVPELRPPVDPTTEKELDMLVNNLPPLGGELIYFLGNLQFINKSEIHLENLFNELITAACRDGLLQKAGKKFPLNPAVAYERHKALNWLRGFMDCRDWDEVDTST